MPKLVLRPRDTARALSSRPSAKKSPVTLAAALAFLLCAHAPSVSAVPIGPGDFLPGATVIDFETGTTALPSVPGVTFPRTSPSMPPWFGGDALFGSPALFGAQSYTNLSSSTYSDLAIVLDTPAPAVGAWVGQNVGTVTDVATMLILAVFDASDVLLEQVTVALRVGISNPEFATSDNYPLCQLGPLPNVGRLRCCPHLLDSFRRRRADVWQPSPSGRRAHSQRRTRRT